ncbi:hypothetical protein H257_14926 [Aphanomyces astaci]|uniref:Uncharacterized protein n=1 Tax=Aphanomyces astaci TaxID=112090 RepID=W4FR58_APHAT|nr:hypothetical protein H257_14926 [Aphanomyces astaci]ETV69299.1 hypothetical protein H257_14926 [Aphanomyces astaci]|eukprot:XP_009841156.1 hypothetical protein H257_14926 [Aphanomyces astaci]
MSTLYNVYVLGDQEMAFAVPTSQRGGSSPPWPLSSSSCTPTRNTRSVLDGVGAPVRQVQVAAVSTAHLTLPFLGLGYVTSHKEEALRRHLFVLISMRTLEFQTSSRARSSAAMDAT